MIKKSDIKPGMGVVLRNGAEGIIIPCTEAPRAIILIDHEGTRDGYMNLDRYDDDLHSSDGPGSYSIDKVYGLCNRYRSARKGNFDDFRELLWDRGGEPQEMTLAQIEKALGHAVKIVKEHEDE